jgi:hypothetical protein
LAATIPATGTTPELTARLRWKLKAPDESSRFVRSFFIGTANSTRIQADTVFIRPLESAVTPTGI